MLFAGRDRDLVVVLEVARLLLLQAGGEVHGAVDVHADQRRDVRRPPARTVVSQYSSARSSTRSGVLVRRRAGGGVAEAGVEAGGRHRRASGCRGSRRRPARAARTHRAHSAERTTRARRLAAQRRQRRRGHLDGLGVGDRAERLEDVAQVDEQRAADGPEALGQSVDGEVAGEGVEVAARRLERARSAPLIASPARSSRSSHGVRKLGSQSSGRASRAGSCSPCCASRRPRARRGRGSRRSPSARRMRSPARAARVAAPALARLAHDAPGLLDVVVELAGALDPAVDVLVVRRAQRRGHVAQQRADAVVDDADLVRGGAVAQRRPHEQVHEQADRDADARVEQARDEHAAVVAVAGE